MAQSSIFPRVFALIASDACGHPSNGKAMTPTSKNVRGFHIITKSPFHHQNARIIRRTTERSGLTAGPRNFAPRTFIACLSEILAEASFPQIQGEGPDQG